MIDVEYRHVDVVSRHAFAGLVVVLGGTDLDAAVAAGWRRTRWGSMQTAPCWLHDRTAGGRFRRRPRQQHFFTHRRP
ncbi:MAG: hypothetical protein WA966_01695 [Ornithinimicrobium sp.]